LAVGENGRISAIGKGTAPAGLVAQQTYDARGKFVIPGFISAHSHIWHSAFRGLAADPYVRGWGDVICRRMAIQAHARDFYWSTVDGCVDHLVHGITSIYNFTYGSQGAGDFANQQWRGEVDCGVRFIHSYARLRDAPAEKQRAGLQEFIAYAKPDL